jgi:hypothetical protein
MNPIQIAVIIFIIIAILFTLIYYWYDDIRFKKKVESNFNKSVGDTLFTTKKIAVFDGVDSNDNQDNQDSILQKDIVTTHITDSADPLFNDTTQQLEYNHTTRSTNDLFQNHDIAQLDNYKETQDSELVTANNMFMEPQHTEIDVPADSTEAFFVQLQKTPFQFSDLVNTNFDLVIDIVFEEPKKLKIFPEITQFTHKLFTAYVLTKNNEWQIFEKGQKYSATALKLVIQLIDYDGLISETQIDNIYNELHLFVIKNDAHIKCSDYKTSILNIQNKLKLYHNSINNLEMYIALHDKLNYNKLKNSLIDYGLVFQEGVFNYIEHGKVLFSVFSHDKQNFAINSEYNLLLIVAKLHLYHDPLHIFNKIFDIFEQFTLKFDSRILKNDKTVITEGEYTQLYNSINNYVIQSKSKAIDLGGVLMHRIHS